MHFFIINTNHIHVFFCKNTKKKQKEALFIKKNYIFAKKRI